MPADRLKAVADILAGSSDCLDCLNALARVDLRPGVLRVQLKASTIANWLGCPVEHLVDAALIIETPFQMRRRGVELKLHLGAPPKDVDHTLIQNITKGQRWLALILGGMSVAAIAEEEDVSIRRVQDITNLALIAPDVIDAISLGEQPKGLTTNYLIKTSFPAIWSQQRDQFAKL